MNGHNIEKNVIELFKIIVALVITAFLIFLYVFVLGDNPLVQSKSLILNCIPSAIVVLIAATLYYFIYQRNGLTVEKSIISAITGLIQEIKKLVGDHRTTVEPMINKQNEKFSELVTKFNRNNQDSQSNSSSSNIAKIQEKILGAWVYVLNGEDPKINIYGRFSVTLENGDLKATGDSWYYGTEPNKNNMRGKWFSHAVCFQNDILWIIYEMQIEIQPNDDNLILPANYKGLLDFRIYGSDAVAGTGKFSRINATGHSHAYGNVNAIRAKKSLTAISLDELKVIIAGAFGEDISKEK